MSLHDVPPMAASSSVQRPLAEGAQGTLGVPPRVEAAAAEPEPEDDPHAFDAGVAVTSLAELEALLERGGPLADEEPAGVDEEQLRAMLDLKPVLVDGLFDPAANDYVAEPAPFLARVRAAGARLHSKLQSIQARCRQPLL